MDVRNRFHTDGTFLLVRAEHLLVVAACTGLVIANLPEVNLWRFALAFIVIDLIGYIPGALRYRRLAGGGPIPPLYHHLYNVTHSYLTAAAVVAVWWLAAGGFEWAMLAIPIHLSGDRGLFGNTYKPVSLPFEPGPVDGRVPEVAP